MSQLVWFLCSWIGVGLVLIGVGLLACSGTRPSRVSTLPDDADVSRFQPGRS